MDPALYQKLNDVTIHIEALGKRNGVLELENIKLKEEIKKLNSPPYYSTMYVEDLKNEIKKLRKESEGWKNVYDKITTYSNNEIKVELPTRQFIIRYPNGAVVTYNGDGSTTTQPNAGIAEEMLDSLLKGKSVAFPSQDWQLWQSTDRQVFTRIC